MIKFLRKLRMNSDKERELQQKLKEEGHILAKSIFGGYSNITWGFVPLVILYIKIHANMFWEKGGNKV